ncbi:MAG: HAMP domain-containing sensor histidine kinase [Sulfuritalea sp.]|nr:HAMP domain-containing sensor histidine kinase [Sulfuritalea sp.]
MDAITWFVPPNVLQDPRKNTRHRGIAKSLPTISLVVSLMYLGVCFVRGTLPIAEHAMFVAGILTPILGALPIRATGDIGMGLVVTNIGGILIIAIWAFLTGGITSIALPGFLANIALLSTFGNPAILLAMGAILELAERLRAEPEHALSKEQLASIGHISTAGRHLLGLVTQVLDMSRIEAGDLRLNMEPVRTDQVIAPCLSLVELAAEKQRISLVDDCDASADWIVCADLALIKQVLLNPLSNAVKFNREGGSVTVSCQRAGAAYLRISVADTGIGVAADRKDELFEPFSRLGAEAGNIQGAGLGLAISKQLIERMRGRIGYDSTEGLGSTFWVELPLAETHVLRS